MTKTILTAFFETRCISGNKIIANLFDLTQATYFG